MENNTNIWYAVMYDNNDDDWGTGSHDLSDAKEMLEGHPDGYIAVIDTSNPSDPVCIDEIRA